MSSNTGVPSSVTDAVLVQSGEMPASSQKVEELDFNRFAGRAITVDDLMSGMNNMGFQASSIGEAVRIINDMVSFHFSRLNHFPYTAFSIYKFSLTSYPHIKTHQEPLNHLFIRTP